MPLPKGNDVSPPRVTVFKRAFRFALTGLLVTAMHAIAAIVLIKYVQIAPPLANGLAFAFATVISCLINTAWSFEGQLRGRTLWRFSLVSILGFMLAMLVASIVESFASSYLFGIGAVALVVPAFTFVLHNFWTYR